MPESPSGGLGLSYPEVFCSGPVDLSLPKEEWEQNVKGKTILITGGASGIGEATARKLAKLGAYVVVGDVNTTKGDELVTQVKEETESENIVCFPCDVTSYTSQAQFFLKALEWSPTKEIHIVIVNAGVAEIGVLLEDEELVTGQCPQEPELVTINVNLKGALYTIRLAHHFLRHNSHPESATPFSNLTSCPPDSKGHRTDRMILITGSYSAWFTSPILPLYSMSKHALLGLFTSLRVTSQTRHRIRINLVCPYFIKTPLMPNSVRLLLSGQQMVEMDHLTGQMIRMCGDERVAGRMLAVGPQGFVEDVDVGSLDEVENFSRRVVNVLNMKYRSGMWWEKWGRIIRDAAIVILGWLGLWLLGQFRGSS